MARPLRIDVEGAWYHVMNRGQELFLDEADRRRFLGAVAELAERFALACAGGARLCADGQPLSSAGADRRGQSEPGDPVAQCELRGEVQLGAPFAWDGVPGPVQIG